MTHCLVLWWELYNFIDILDFRNIFSYISCVYTLKKCIVYEFTQFIEIEVLDIETFKPISFLKIEFYLCRASSRVIITSTTAYSAETFWLRITKSYVSTSNQVWTTSKVKIQRRHMHSSSFNGMLLNAFKGRKKKNAESYFFTFAGSLYIYRYEETYWYHFCICAFT